MQHFLVVAYDGTDAEAPTRRQSIRPAHLDNLNAMVARGEVVSGGPILNEGGGVIGSTMTVGFNDRAGLDAWLKREPYVLEGVWQKIEVTPMRLVIPAPE